MKIFYGLNENRIDITSYCLKKLMIKNIIVIPNNDNNRAFYFGDPIFGKKKFIIIELNCKNYCISENFTIKINLNKNLIEFIDENENLNKLKEIHNSLIINYGSLGDELPEQLLFLKYIKGNEKVLEIGGNIGRNSLIISKLLKDSTNLLVLESDLEISKKLQENKELNNLNFKIENSALSKNRLIQKEWNTYPFENNQEIPSGFKLVKTISYLDLKNKYVDFFSEQSVDTLVLDCEGAFYNILNDFPEILDGVKLIIMENDYLNINHKNYVDKVLEENKFTLDYFQAGGWGPCINNFYEVWKRV
jgi:FkbM family methyltransferase